MSQSKCYVGRYRPMTVQDWKQLGWEQEDAERYALLDHTTADVVVIDRDGVRPLAHHRRHSSEFNWGYGGSGPSDLARCILLDHYGVPGDAEEEYSDSPRLPVSYQQFKFDVIAKLPQGEPWSISAEQIEQWAAAR